MAKQELRMVSPELISKSYVWCPRNSCPRNSYGSILPLLPKLFDFLQRPALRLESVLPDDPPCITSLPFDRLSFSLRVRRVEGSLDSGEVTECLGSEIGAIGPNDCAANGIEFHTRKKITFVQRFKNRPIKDLSQANHLVSAVVERNAYAGIAANFSFNDAKDHVQVLLAADP